jgi:hypothetical protein
MGPLLRILLPLALVLLTAERSWAGPCAPEIDKTQAQIDSALDQQAGAGKSGAIGQAVTDHRQPTPESIAAAEKALGEGASIRQALAALTRARTGDEKGDAAECQSDLAEAQKALKP